MPAQNSIIDSAKSPRTGFCWTGGKDGCLALHLAVEQGIRPDLLITFGPPHPSFRAHPLLMMQLQANALNIPHQYIPLLEPFDQGYESAFKTLCDQEQLTDLFTGDMARVGGQPNWIRERARSFPLEIHTPLWGMDREKALQLMWERDFDIQISFVRHAWIPADWAGTRLESNRLPALKRLSKETGLDLCGENGEYHSIVLDALLFKEKISIKSSQIRTAEDESWMEWTHPHLSPKFPCGIT